MAKEKKIHVLADETLGGVKREYIEVERKAEVGDKVVCTNDCIQGGRYYRVGDVGKMIYKSEEYPSIRVKFVGCKGGSLEVGESFVGNEHYRTLEQTDIIHIGDKRFRLDKRRAAEGEIAIYFSEGKSDGIVFEVLGSGFTDIEVDYEDEEGVQVVGIEHGAYLVLEPIESVESETPPRSTDDIIANLVRRVAQLESELTGAKRDVETWSREIETLKHAVKHTDEKAEMCIDDIVMLDERTQSKKVSMDADLLVKLIGGEIV